MIKRLLEKKLKSTNKSVLLLGPRQVGKSTLIKLLSPDLIINLADEKTFLTFKKNPNELHERIYGVKAATIFIDEIQKHPSLLGTVQDLIDNSTKKIKFYITGSSARKLRRGQANLLPGRIFSYEIGPLCANELDYKIDVKKALSYGCLPESYLNSDNEFNEKLLTTYSAIYLKEEIQAEALTRSLDGFARFLEMAATTSSQVLDFSKIAKLARIERKNCSRFYEILEDTLIGQRIEVFHKTEADIIKRPKFYFFDTGVLNGLLDNFNASPDRIGFLMETLVFAQINSSAKASDQKIKLYYFRTRSGYEVDLILEIKNKTYAIEVKSGVVSNSDAKKLESISSYYNFSGYFIVSNEKVHRKIGKVLICDLNRLLQEIGL